LRLPIIVALVGIVIKTSFALSRLHRPVINEVVTAHTTTPIEQADDSRTTQHAHACE
jgi:hypothetical protein